MFRHPVRRAACLLLVGRGTEIMPGRRETGVWSNPAFLEGEGRPCPPGGRMGGIFYLLMLVCIVRDWDWQLEVPMSNTITTNTIDDDNIGRIILTIGR